MIFALLLFVGFGATNLNAAPTEDQTVKFVVEKMTCATCPIAVRKAMQRVDGVKDVKVDLDSKTAVVTFDASKTTADAIGAASKNVGFPATPVSD